MGPMSEIITQFSDQCLNVQSGSYASETSCRNYWKCNGYSVPVCCPKGHAYVTALGCVPDISCQDECSMYTDKATDNPGNDEPIQNKINSLTINSLMNVTLN